MPSTASKSDRSRQVRERLASVVTKQSMVAMEGQNHPRPFHAGTDGHCNAINFGTHCQLLMAGVGSENRLRHLGAIGGLEIVHKSLAVGQNSFHRHLQPDHSGRTNAHFTTTDSQRFGHEICHCPRILQPFDTGARIGISRIRDDRPDVVVLQIGLRNLNWGSLHPIGGEGASRNTRMLRINQSQVFSLSVGTLDTCRNSAGQKTNRCANATLLFIVRHSGEFWGI